MATYPHTAHILASPENVALVEAAVRDMAAAEGIVVTPLDVSHAVAAQIREANERNITGARYLTHASVLVAANEYVAMHALRDVRHASASAGPDAANDAANDASDSTVRNTRRREVSMRTASVDWPSLPRTLEPVAARTPRSLLR